MNKTLIFIILILSVITISGCISDVSKEKPVKLQPPAHGVYLSAFPDFGGPEDNVTPARITAFKKLTGKDIVWAPFSDNWGTSNITFPEKSVQIIHQQGIVPYIRLMPRNTLDEAQGPDSTYTLQRIIDGDFDLKLREWAHAAKTSGIPLMIDFAPEMNGNWFSWSGIYNGGSTKNQYGNPDLADGPERYRDAYRHIIDIFKEEGANNITWVFHVDAYSTPEESWNNFKAYYPGDDYIDWIGISVYGAQTPDEEWESFSQVMDSSYPQLTNISKTKPLAVLEFGVTERDNLKANWIVEAIESIKNNKYSQIKAISYWHENWENDDGTISQLRLDSSPEVLEVYKKEIKNSFFIDKANFSF